MNDIFESFDYLSEKTKKGKYFLEFAEKLFKEAKFEEIYDISDPRAVEILFWNFTKNYVEGLMDIHTFIRICDNFDGDPIFHNMSQEAQIAILDGFKLDMYLYFEPDSQKIDEINTYLKEDVDNFFKLWYLNFKN